MATCHSASAFQAAEKQNICACDSQGEKAQLTRQDLEAVELQWNFRRSIPETWTVESLVAWSVLKKMGLP